MTPKLLLAISAAGLLLTGCHHEYRLLDDNFSPFAQLPPRTAVPLPLPMIEHARTFDTAYIEFDDQGRLFDTDRYQARKTVELIQATKPANIVFYVHGWNNNASENSADVTRFHGALTYLSAKLKPNGSLLGVYIGWRGGTLKGGILGPFTFLTYWSRKEGARRVGYGDPNTDISRRLTSVIDELTMESETAHHGRRFYAIGHSFGARVLEAALQKSDHFNKFFAALDKGEDSVPLPIDLVLLINPATDSMLTKQLVEKANRLNKHGLEILHPDWDAAICGKGGSDPLARICRPYPLMVEMSSLGDIPTRFVMPVANLVNWIPPMPLVSHPSARLQSAPFTPSLQTHRVRPCLQNVQDCGSADEHTEFDFTLIASPNRPTERLERVDGMKSPFVWVLPVDREISENHGDVWNGNVAAMMFELVDPQRRQKYTPADLEMKTPPVRIPAPPPPALQEHPTPQRFGAAEFTGDIVPNDIFAPPPSESARPKLMRRQ